MPALKNFIIGTAIITGLSSFFLKSCKTSKVPIDKISTKIDTLLVEHSECTECADAYIVEGILSIPDSIRKTLYSDKDIFLEGNNPYKNGKNLNKKIKINGYVIKVDSVNSNGKALSFWVLTWNIIDKKVSKPISI